jgi:hypothetical protein
MRNTGHGSRLKCQVLFCTEAQDPGRCGRARHYMPEWPKGPILEYTAQAVRLFQRHVAYGSMHDP